MLAFDISSIFNTTMCEVGHIFYYNTNGVLSVCYKKVHNLMNIWSENRTTNCDDESPFCR